MSEPKRVMVEVEMTATVQVRVEVEIDPNEPDGDPRDLTAIEIAEACDTAQALVGPTDWLVMSVVEAAR